MTTTTTTFDAGKLIAGKKYPTRDGRHVEFMLAFVGMLHDQKLLFMMTFDDGTQTPMETYGNGQRQKDSTCDSDIVSDEPWIERMKPVEVDCITPYVAVFRDGSISKGFDDFYFAERYAKDERCIGVAMLDATLTVTPVNHD